MVPSNIQDFFTKAFSVTSTTGMRFDGNRLGPNNGIHIDKKSKKSSTSNKTYMKYFSHFISQSALFGLQGNSFQAAGVGGF